jgi:uncharacterized protein
MSHPEVVASTAEALIGELEDLGPRPGADVGAPMMSGRVLKTWTNVETGVWRCTPGGWPVEDRPDEESVIILAGRARVTDASGTVTELSEGSTAVFPRGWYGRWDIEETIIKYYVSIK